MIKVISFDLDGTLLDLRFTTIVWEIGVPRLYAQKYGLDFKEAQERVFAEYESVGEGRAEWYDIKYWFRRFGLGDGWEKLIKEFENEIEVYPEVPETLESLKEDFKLIITSNASREFIDAGMRVSGLDIYFAHVFSATSDFGLVKKSADFYHLVCRTIGVKPEEMVHVGDHYNFDFLTPRGLRIKSFYIDRKGEGEGEWVLHDLRGLREKIKDLI